MDAYAFPTHTLICGPPHAKFSLAWEVEGLEGREHFTFYESLGAELTTREEILRVLSDIGDKCEETRKPIIWRINHVDAVSSVVAYILHSLMVNDYVTYKGGRYGGVPVQVVGITSNLANVPRILMSAFHLQRTYDEAGHLVREAFLNRGAATPDATRGVYFLRAGESGNIKIGKTYDLNARVASLQTGSPEPLRLLAFINCREVNPTDAEAAMHGKFQQYRLQGEWFRPADELLDFIRGLGTDSETTIQDQQVTIRGKSSSNS